MTVWKKVPVFIAAVLAMAVHAEEPAAQRGTTLFYADFKAKSPDWRSYASYKNSLEYCFETMDGAPALVIRNKNKTGGDTGWKIVSRTIKLNKTEKKILFEISCKATNASENGQYGKGQWRSGIVWYGNGSKLVKEVPINFIGKPDGFTTTQQIVEVPEGAVSFVLMIGADAPDIRDDSYLALRFVRVADVSAEK